MDLPDTLIDSKIKRKAETVLESPKKKRKIQPKENSAGSEPSTKADNTPKFGKKKTYRSKLRKKSRIYPFGNYPDYYG